MKVSEWNYSDWIKRYWQVGYFMVDVLWEAKEPITSCEITKEIELKAGWQYDSDWTINWLEYFMMDKDADAAWIEGKIKYWALKKTGWQHDGAGITPRQWFYMNKKGPS